MWINIEFKKIYNDCKKTGIRLRFYKGVNEEVQKFCKDFCKWLRTLYWFPVRCNIHFFNYKYFMYSNKKSIAEIFYFGNDENGFVAKLPVIYIATGTYEKEIVRREKRVVLFNYLGSIAHELTHYYQWYFNDIDTSGDKRTNRSLESEATRWMNYLLDTYWAKLYGVDENGFLK